MSCAVHLVMKLAVPPLTPAPPPPDVRQTGGFVPTALKQNLSAVMPVPPTSSLEAGCLVPMPIPTSPPRTLSPTGGLPAPRIRPPDFIWGVTPTLSGASVLPAGGRDVGAVKVAARAGLGFRIKERLSRIVAKSLAVVADDFLFL